MSDAARTNLNSSGEVRIDAEHQVQMGLIRALDKALEEGDDITAAELLTQLEDYTDAHFLGEQLLMRLQGYGDYEAHCQEHETLLEQLTSVRASLASDSPEDRRDAFKTFEEHITHHIAGSDHALERAVGQD